MSAFLRNQRFWIITAMVVGVSYVWLPLLASGDRTPPVREQDIPEMNYLCKETQQFYQLKAQPLPALNPETGRATLWPAMYCTSCQSWMIVPEIPLQGSAPSCPKHLVPLKRSVPDTK